jgi:hypothetical protein
MSTTLSHPAALAAAFIVLGSSLASAHTIEQRQTEQRYQIELGRETGSVTWLEGRRLRAEQQRIMQVEKSLKADGALSARDRRILRTLQNDAEAHIVAEKTDNRRRWRFLPRIGN